MSDPSGKQMKRCPECGALAELSWPVCPCGRRFRTVMAGGQDVTADQAAPTLDATRSIPAVSLSPEPPKTNPASTGAAERIARVLRIPFWFVMVLFGLYLIAVLFDSISSAISG